MPKYRIQRKILYFNSILIFVVTLVIIVFAYIVFQNQQHTKYINMLNNVADNQESHVSQLLTAADTVSLQIAFNNQIVDTFSDPEIETDGPSNYFTDLVDERVALYEGLIPYVINYNTINRIVLLNDKGDFVCTGKAINDNAATNLFTKEYVDNLQDRLARNNYKPILVFHLKDSLRINEREKEGYIALIRPIFDIRSTTVAGINLGLCEVHIPVSNLQIDTDILSNMDYKIYYNNQVVQEYRTLSGSDPKEVITKEINKYPGFNLTISGNNVTQPLIRSSFIFFIIAIAILMGTLIFVFERLVLIRATNPLVELCNDIQLQSLGENFQSVDKKELDEVGTLYNSFNNMINRLQNTVDELVAARTGKVEAQMLALQAQVNPHFIHNTLAIISSLAEEGRVDKVETITTKLSSLIRYSSDFSHQEKLLSEELDYIKDYLDLLKERFEEDFSYSIEGRNTVENIEVPKFILQPLIENSMNHSLKFSDYPWRINIKAISNQKYWRVLIEDNGAGISDEKIIEISDKISKISQSSLEELMNRIHIGGFSLLNSMVRLYLMFPGNTYFKIERNENGGTSITIGADINE
jgi:sensor histidine kinase YesM/preprotein translocase subunit YajC